MEKFKPDERVVLTTNNRFGGPGCGAKGDTGTVVRYHSDKSLHPKTIMVSLSTHHGVHSWWCHENDLATLVITYDPMQQGDTDEDI